MSALLGFLLFAIAPGHVAHCGDFELIETHAWGEQTVVLDCHDNGITYPEGNYALHHDRDDGDIVRVEVWR